MTLYTELCIILSIIFLDFDSIPTPLFIGKMTTVLTFNHVRSIFCYVFKEFLNFYLMRYKVVKVKTFIQVSFNIIIKFLSRREDISNFVISGIRCISLLVLQIIIYLLFLYTIYAYYLIISGKFIFL